MEREESRLRTTFGSCSLHHWSTISDASLKYVISLFRVRTYDGFILLNSGNTSCLTLLRLYSTEEFVLSSRYGTLLAKACPSICLREWRERIHAGDAFEAGSTDHIQYHRLRIIVSMMRHDDSPVTIFLTKLTKPPVS